MVDFSPDLPSVVPLSALSTLGAHQGQPYMTPAEEHHDVGERLARIETKLNVLLEHHTETQAELVDLDVRLRAAETQLAGLTASIGGLRGVDNDEAAPSVDINGLSGFTKQVRFQTAGATRWAAGASGVAESGADTGSDFTVARYDDAGDYIDNPVAIGRADGVLTLNSVWFKPGATISNVSAINVASGAKPTITGSRSTDTASVLGQLLSGLSALGLINNSTSS